MPDVRFDISITTVSALSVGAGGSSGTLADKSIVRNGRGQPIIPGSQLKGRLRHAAEAVLRRLGHNVPDVFADSPHDDGKIATIFGIPNRRSPLRFNDLVCIADSSIARDLAEIRPSVSVNRRRGTAEDARLFYQETAHASLVYQGTISGRLDKLADVALLWAALRLSRRWGGGSSRGLGWADVAVTVIWDQQELAEKQLIAELREWKGDQV